jgi:heat shock protein HslJ
MGRRGGDHLPAKIAFLIIAAACIISIWCIGGAKTTVDSRSGAGTVIEPLAGTAWHLAAYRAEDGSVIPALPDPRTEIIFRDAGTLYGSAGCNRYSASYQINGSSLSVRSVAVSEVYCTEPVGLMQQESRFVKLLVTVSSYRVEEDRLDLLGPSGRELMTFERMEQPRKHPLLNTTWALDYISAGGNAVASPIEGTEITAVFAGDGTVSGSAGCNAYSAVFQVNETHLTMERIISTKTSCTEPEGIMKQEGRYLNLTGTVAGYRIEDDSLTLIDGSGRAILFYSART